MKNKKKWTKEEIKYLEQAVEYTSLKTIAEELNRTENSVYLKSCKLGLKTTKKRYNNDDDNYLKWELCNQILNLVRNAKGLPLVNKKDNPYLLRSDNEYNQ